MDKFLIRFTVVFTAVYFLYVLALALNGDIFFNDFYIVLFELCVCAG